MQLQVSTSMLDLCFDAFGISREKKDSKEIKGNRGDVHSMSVDVVVIFCFVVTILMM